MKLNKLINYKERSNYQKTIVKLNTFIQRAVEQQRTSGGSL